MTVQSLIIGHKVWECALEVASRGVGVWRGYFTVKQVSDACGMSKPTVRKYLDMLVENGVISSSGKSGMTTVLYFVNLGGV